MIKYAICLILCITEVFGLMELLRCEYSENDGSLHRYRNGNYKTGEVMVKGGIIIKRPDTVKMMNRKKLTNNKLLYYYYISNLVKPGASETYVCIEHRTNNIRGRIIFNNTNTPTIVTPRPIAKPITTTPSDDEYYDDTDSTANLTDLPLSSQSFLSSIIDTAVKTAIDEAIGGDENDKPTEIPPLALYQTFLLSIVEVIIASIIIVIIFAVSPLIMKKLCCKKKDEDVEDEDETINVAIIKPNDEIIPNNPKLYVKAYLKAFDVE